MAAFDFGQLASLRSLTEVFGPMCPILERQRSFPIYTHPKPPRGRAGQGGSAPPAERDGKGLTRLPALLGSDSDMTAPQRTQRSRWCLAGVLVAFHVCFGPSLKAAVVTETFTDYNAFLSLLGPTAQVVNFDDVPTVPFNGSSVRIGFFDSDRYASQGILIRANGGAQAVTDLGGIAVSPPNVYYSSTTGSSFREGTFVSFTHDGQPALSSAFGAFFIGNTEPFGPGSGSISGFSIGEADHPSIYAGLTSLNGSTFLGLATVDSVSGDLVPAISEITIRAGSHGAGPEPDLDNFVFAGNPGVSPVPEGNVWALLAAAALATVGLARRRAAAP
jgi:hypothetical protein